MILKDFINFIAVQYYFEMKMIFRNKPKHFLGLFMIPINFNHFILIQYHFQLNLH